MTVRVGLVQLKVGLDKAVNLQRMSVKVAEAAMNGAQMIVLPVGGLHARNTELIAALQEFFNAPYGMDTLDQYAEPLTGPSVRALCEAAASTKTLLVGGSIPERDGDRIYNTCVVVDAQGRVIGRHRKAHLFDIDIPGRITFCESDRLTSGNRVSVFATEFGAVGVGICYDLRFPDLAAACVRRHGARMMVYPGAFNTVTGPLHWSLLLRARAVDEQVWVLGCSSARNEEGYRAYGHSMVVDPMGRVVVEAGEEEVIAYATVGTLFIAGELSGGMCL